MNSHVLFSDIRALDAHSGVYRMNFVQKLAVAAIIAGFSVPFAVPANAFEQQSSGAAPAASPTTQAVKPPQTDLAPPGEIGDTTGGTEVRIPGLGKLGELPKMDFGLELLYGAAESEKVVDESEEPNATSDDLRIRGTIKHQF